MFPLFIYFDMDEWMDTIFSSHDSRDLGVGYREEGVFVSGGVEEVFDE